MDGMAMADEKDTADGQTRMKDSRQDRLKSALRENLKRRKVQARERGEERGKKTDMPSGDHDASPDGELGRRED
jgi:hypothetical protein